MQSWMRRIRAAAAVGLTWAVAWFGAGLALLAVVGVGAADVPFPLFFGLLGFLAGSAFSVILGMLGRRRRFEQLSLWSVAGWGALGGLLIAGGVALAAGPGGDLLVLAPVFATAGAVSAAGTLAIARRAEGRALLDSAAGDESQGRLPRDR